MQKEIPATRETIIFRGESWYFTTMINAELQNTSMNSVKTDIHVPNKYIPNDFYMYMYYKRCLVQILKEISTLNQ